MIRARYHTLKDFATLGRPYFSEEFTIEPKALAKNLQKDARLKEWLPELADRLEALAPFTLESTEAVVRAFAEERGVKAGLIINYEQLSLHNLFPYTPIRLFGRQWRMSPCFPGYSLSGCYMGIQ